MTLPRPSPNIVCIFGFSSNILVINAIPKIHQYQIFKSSKFSKIGIWINAKRTVQIFGLCSNLIFDHFLTIHLFLEQCEIFVHIVIYTRVPHFCFVSNIISFSEIKDIKVKKIDLVENVKNRAILPIL